MNTVKSLGLVALAATALFAAQAFATPVTCPTGTQGSPVCIAPSSLQDFFNSITKPGTTQIDVYNGQTTPSAYWSVSSSGLSENKFILASSSGYSFGIFDPSQFNPANPNTYLPLFTSSATAGSSTTLSWNGGGSYTAYYLGSGTNASANFSVTNKFGYYLEDPNGNFFFSDPTMNGAGGTTYPNGMPEMVAYAGQYGIKGNNTQINTGPGYANFTSGEYLLAWDGETWANTNLDYSNFVVMVESVHPVPEPAVLGMFGLGVLLLGGFATLRRRSFKA